MRFKWIIEVEVDEMWVADGFELDDRRVEDIMMHTLPHAYSHEIGGRVISGPPEEEIARAQGFKSIEAYRKSNER